MKPFSRIFALLTVLCLLAGLTPALADAPVAPSASEKTLTVLFTHDTHDHFLPDAADVGGYTRLATLLKQERAASPNPTVTLDAGDFSMGSFLQTVYATDAPELRALGYMGYDVTTFGNHEYDFRPEGLASMLRNAKASGDPLPLIVQSNYRTPKDDSAQVAIDAMTEFPVYEFVVIEKEGIRIGVFGLVGVDSDECTPMSGMALEPIAQAAQRMVDFIKGQEVDYIVALSHVGTEKGQGEDYELAKAVDGIDLIISGHTHTTLDEPIVVNNTAIVSCGPYTRNLGKVTLSKENGKTVFTGYTLLPIDNTIPADPGMEALVAGFKERVNENYLANYNLGYDQVLARSSIDFTTAEMGDFIGDAYIATVRELEGAASVPIAFAVCPDGVIRDRIRKGDITTANAFDILSLGVGADGTPGYPLISLYLTGKDLKNAFEVDASVSPLMSGTALFGAGSRWTYNPNRMFLDRVTASSLADGSSIDDGALYRVVADLYSGQMLATVKEKSFGLLSITPRDAQGNEVTDVESLIIHDANGNEVKAWYALAHYIESGSPIAPPISSKTVTPSWNPVALLIPMGAPTLLVAVLALLLILAVVLIVRAVIRRVRRSSRRGYTPYQGRK